MLPIIFVMGITGSGKGTLSTRLAADFGLYHVSIGDEFRAARKARKEEIPGMPCEINEYLIERTEIPTPLLHNLFKPVPFVLLLHNSIVRGEEFNATIIAQLLKEKSAKAMERKGDLPRAMIVDSLDALRVEEINDLRGALQQIAPTFSGLTIHIQCPENVARKRFLLRARSPHDDARQFRRRMEWHEEMIPQIVDQLQGLSVVVETVNDDTMTVDEAFRILSEKLDKVPEWKRLMEGST
ncbi:hypothetical protein GQX73_g5749 [Xylaria multiplex]|uniref:Uncharacterized protein n=1 Tax=Xylaria multiplex TaxID=323545 RepID=A0A7C8IS99_9PEZI|nr:hypothetical protein GQX73_g5749 [Xylaria multiplex]